MSEEKSDAWAKGFPIPWLKSIALIFRTEFKPYTHGAFGIPNAREIRAARPFWARPKDLGLSRLCGGDCSVHV